jgi:transposase
LGGILWVARTGSSWREMPEEFGKWKRAYRRHELWVKQGLWQRILRVLYRSGLLMSQRIDSLYPPRETSELLEASWLLPVGLKCLAERLLQ